MPTPVPKNKLIVGREYAGALIEAIADAKSSIRVFMYEWRINKSDFSSDTALITHALTRAVARGVDVRAFVNSAKIAEQLLAAKIDARVYADRSLMHAKTVVVDGSIVLIGSHNITENAMQYNVEMSVLLHDPDIGKMVLSYFDSLWLL